MSVGNPRKPLTHDVSDNIPNLGARGETVALKKLLSHFLAFDTDDGIYKNGSIGFIRHFYFSQYRECTRSKGHYSYLCQIFHQLPYHTVITKVSSSEFTQVRQFVPSSDSLPSKRCCIHNIHYR